MIRLNTFTVYKNKHNKFAKQYLYFLRNSRMGTLKIVGLQKIFSTFWGSKIITFNLNFLFKFFFFKSFTFLKKMLHVFDFVILNLLLKCFSVGFILNLFGFCSYIFLLKLKTGIFFVKNVIIESLASYSSIFKFRIFGKNQAYRLFVLNKNINI